MRILRYFQVGERGWIFPSELWQALHSGEELSILAPELTHIDNVLSAFDDAAGKLKQKWLFDARNSAISAIWCSCVILGLLWPPLAAKMPEVVQKVLLGLLGAGILAEIASVAQIWRKKRLLVSGKAKVRDSARKAVRLMPPAAFYRSGTHFPKKSIRIALSCLLALLALNSTVWAFPSCPAAVFPPHGEPYVTKVPRFVIPGTEWEWRQEYYVGSAMALLAVAEDEETAWVIDITYRVWQPDMLQSPGPWRKWIVGRLEWLARQVSDSIWQGLAPEMEQGARTTALVEAIGDPDLQDMIAEVLTEHFNEHHTEIMRLTVTHLEVVEVSLGDYFAIARSQNKE